MDAELKQDCIRMAENGATAQNATSLLVRVLDLLAKASKKEPHSQPIHNDSTPPQAVSPGPILTRNNDFALGHHRVSLSLLSFAVPRKKLSLSVHTNALVLSTKFEHSRIRNDSTACIIPSTCVTAILCLPTPNKPKPNYTVAICFDSLDSSVFNNPALSGLPMLSSPILFSFDNTGAKYSTSNITDAYPRLLQ
ncbi:hypothetical protein HDU80_007757 [Chytriomyces hyalinus]|nr:hypothetical protein HDU80_007757 [Chytriomyces hyalinus]